MVLLGADPLRDFPDARLARRALDGAEFVVAVATAPGDVTEAADVVLPAAEAHERPGTTTNLEGRVSRLGQKLVPPGQAWPDWMIAVELAVHLDGDLGLDSVGDVWDEIERLAPAYQGITRAVLDGVGAADGVVAPLAASAVTLGRRDAGPLDPIAVPGVESVERQGAPPRAGLAESPERRARRRRARRRHRRARPDPAPRPVRPPRLDVPHVVPNDSTRSGWWPPGRSTTGGPPWPRSPPWPDWWPRRRCGPTPSTSTSWAWPRADRYGCAPPRASLWRRPWPTTSLPRKVVAADFNVPLDEGTVADLIDAAAPVVELRMETP